MSWLEGAVKKRAMLKRQWKKGSVRKKIALDLTADTIESREIIDRLEELMDEKERAIGNGKEDEFDISPEGQELEMLEKVNKEYENSHVWGSGEEKLIREDHFEDSTKELADDIGATPSDISQWPRKYIDWEAAADELKGIFLLLK